MHTNIFEIISSTFVKLKKKVKRKTFFSIIQNIKTRQNQELKTLVILLKKKFRPLIRKNEITNNLNKKLMRYRQKDAHPLTIETEVTSVSTEINSNVFLVLFCIDHYYFQISFLSILFISNFYSEILFE